MVVLSVGKTCCLLLWDDCDESGGWLLCAGVFSGLKEIIRREHFFALYKGNFAQMVRIFPYAATQFTAFEIYKKVRLEIDQFFKIEIFALRLNFRPSPAHR